MGEFDSKEELECAKESVSQFCQWRWQNWSPLQFGSHWLQNYRGRTTSTDFFYPDFVCRLTDGRILVVEFKDGDADKGWYALPESEEKRLVGAIWAKRSNGRCLFYHAKGQRF